LSRFRGIAVAGRWRVEIKFYILTPYFGFLVTSLKRFLSLWGFLPI
jgi:hypothetical protein